MRRLALLLLLLLAVAAHPETLALGPESELVPRRTVRARDLRFVGAATDGADVLLVWSREDPWTHQFTAYAGFAAGRLQPLPMAERPLCVAWSGASYFVVTSGESGLHLFPVARDGRVSTPRELGRESVWQASAASNGDGFLLATNGARWDVSVRLYDRNGKPRGEFTVYGQVFQATTRGKDYVVVLGTNQGALHRVIVHPRGAHDEEMTPHKIGSPISLLAARDAAIVRERDPAADTLCLGERDIHLGADENAVIAWDGASYLVLTSKELRRYAPDGTLLASTAGAYDTPLAIVTRRGKPPFLLFQTKDNALHASDGTFEMTAEQTTPAASSDGASTVVAWQEQNGIAATVFSAPGEPRRTIDLPGSTPVSNINTISLGGIHYVVWRDDASIRMMRINARGELLDAQPVVLAKASKSWTFPVAANTPGLATDGRKVLVTWCADRRIWALWLTPGQPLEEPFVVDSSEREKAPLAVQATFNGADVMVVWSEQTTEPQTDFGPGLVGIYSAVVRGRAATLRKDIALYLLYPVHFALAPGRAMWPEYRTPSHLSDSEEWHFYFSTVPLTSDGAATSMPARTAYLQRKPWKQSPAMDLAVYDAHALWSEENALMAMPLDGEWKQAGDPVKIGEAMSGTLRVVETRAGTLVVYARRDGGVPRLFIRPGTSRTTRDTSAPRGSR